MKVAARWSLLQVTRRPGCLFIRQLNGAVSSRRNLIGPPDPVSNIRPIKRRDPRNDAVWTCMLMYVCILCSMYPHRRKRFTNSKRTYGNLITIFGVNKTRNLIK